MEDDELVGVLAELMQMSADIERNILKAQRYQDKCQKHVAGKLRKTLGLTDDVALWLTHFFGPYNAGVHGAGGGVDAVSKRGSKRLCWL